MERKRIHVVAAVIRGQAHQVLIAKRPDHLHMGGLWEFPGGKREAGETPEQALARELHEELGIRPRAARPLIQVAHDYPDKSVLLDVWEVTQFEGIPTGREGQAVRWVASSALPDFQFPAANLPIVTAAQLADHYLITGEADSADQWLGKLARAMAQGGRLFLLRPFGFEADPPSLFESLSRLPDFGACRFMLHARLAWRPLLDRYANVGLHLSSQHLADGEDGGGRCWLSASCHNAQELHRAEQLGIHFALLSPVMATKTYAPAQLLGWSGLADLVRPARLPVYALGGLGWAEIPAARQNGAQGVAMVRGWWDLPKTTN